MGDLSQNHRFFLHGTRRLLGRGFTMNIVSSIHLSAWRACPPVYEPELGLLILKSLAEVFMVASRL